MLVDLTQYLWIAWLVLIVLFVIIEVLTLDFTFLMLAFGSLAGLGAELLGAEWWVQLLAASVLSVLLLLLIRPALLKFMARDSDPTPTNVAALLVLIGRVIETVTELGGLVKLSNGETWTARLADPDSPALEPGASVTVSSIDGSIAMVAPAPARTPRNEDSPA